MKNEKSLIFHLFELVSNIFHPFRCENKWFNNYTKLIKNFGIKLDVYCSLIFTNRRLTRCVGINNYFEIVQCAMYFLNSFVDNLFPLKIKPFLKVIFISRFLQICNIFFWCFWLILFLFEVFYILLNIIIMHSIFLISSGIIS